MPPVMAVGDPEQMERELRDTLARHPRGILVTSGHVVQAFAPVLDRFAERRESRVFPLETGIVCTRWERTGPAAKGRS